MASSRVEDVWVHEMAWERGRGSGVSVEVAM